MPFFRSADSPDVVHVRLVMADALVEQPNQLIVLETELMTLRAGGKVPDDSIPFTPQPVSLGLELIFWSIQLGQDAPVAGVDVRLHHVFLVPQVVNFLA